VNDEHCLDKVRKLLAHAENAGTEAEAEVFNAKAAELIARYGIEEALLASSWAKPDTVAQRRVRLADPYSRGKARLLVSVARPLRCAVIEHTRRGGSVSACTLFGFTADPHRVEVLYTSPLPQAPTLIAGVRPPAGSGESVTGYRRNWLGGFSVAVHARPSAAEQHAARDAENPGPDQAAPGSAHSSTALVLLDRNAQLQRAVAEAYPVLSKARARCCSGAGRRRRFRRREPSRPRQSDDHPTSARPTRPLTPTSTQAYQATPRRPGRVLAPARGPIRYRRPPPPFGVRHSHVSPDLQR